MILVFGGTTEGKKVIEILERSQLPYVYSTKTEINFPSSTLGTNRFGAFTVESLRAFCLQNDIQTIIHASHPFAEVLHKTIAAVATELKIPVMRWERVYPDRNSNELVHYFSSYDDAIVFLEDQKMINLLALTGVQTIVKLKKYWHKNKTFFRILPRESSLKIALAAGFPKENLVLEMPSDEIQHELDLIKQYDIECMVTKESGESGFLSTKIEAALQNAIPILIIERPQLPDSFISVSTKDELFLHLDKSVL